MLIFLARYGFWHESSVIILKEEGGLILVVLRAGGPGISWTQIAFLVVRRQ